MFNIAKMTSKKDLGSDPLRPLSTKDILSFIFLWKTSLNYINYLLAFKKITEIHTFCQAPFSRKKWLPGTKLTLGGLAEGTPQYKKKKYIYSMFLELSGL